MSKNTKNSGPTREQTGPNLAAGAEGGLRPASAVGLALPQPSPRMKADVLKATAALAGRPPCHTCKVRVKVAIFFDGTGNNLDADIGTKEHSNVARLFRSHDPDDEAIATYRAYVPGLGTYFKDIGDPGDEYGLAFGRRGEPRLEWAMQQIDKFLANHPADKIDGLDIALFGFSRGATLARAFALRVQKRCREVGARWVWAQGGFEARLIFMGLFDTVASVGFPASTGGRSLGIGKGWTSLDSGLDSRRRDPANGLETIDEESGLGIAFGERPGADPTPGVIDGHAQWASDLRIPEMALKVVHYTASHEVRNSFPLDCARQGLQYPIAVDERVYPGVHSNVGGGYRPGEGGKSSLPRDMLSLIPLLAMHDAALSAGVPLAPKNDPRSGDDFVVSPELLKRFNAYVALAAAQTSQPSIEGRTLAGMKLYYAWRFKRIRERGGLPRSDGPTIKGEEARYGAEAAQLERDISAAQNNPERLAAQARLKAAEHEYATARSAQYRGSTRGGWGGGAMGHRLARLQKAKDELEKARANFAEADDAHMRLLAKKATLPGSGLLDRLSLYDRHLLKDVQALQNMRRLHPQARLRPHYRGLLDAYEAEFLCQSGLLDHSPDVLALFDHHVHDSLAGFAKDATLPSDPRVVYVGGDDESRYAESQQANRRPTVA